MKTSNEQGREINLSATKLGQKQTALPGSVLRVSSDGDDRMGAKINTQKSP